jgi:hypothetical protein
MNALANNQLEYCFHLVILSSKIAIGSKLGTILAMCSPARNNNQKMVGPEARKLTQSHRLWPQVKE